MFMTFYRKYSGAALSLIALAVLLVAASASKAETVLITGANSGIGLEFSKQYASKGWTVIATHRRDEIPETLSDLQGKHENVQIETMDVTSRDQVFGLAEKLEDQQISVLINNAGIFCFCDWMDETYAGQRFGSLNYDSFETIMLVNVRGVAMVSEAFADHVKRSGQKKMITMTSALGGLNRPKAGLDAMWYGASKAAVNKINVAMAESLKSDGVIVVPMHPGSVAVEKQEELDVSDNPQVLSPEESVSSMIATIQELEIEDSGRLLRYDGVELTW